MLTLTLAGPRVGEAELPPASIPTSRSEEYQCIVEGSATRPQILIVEDNQGDVFVMEESLREHRIDCQIIVLSNGEEAISLFDRIDQDPAGPCPHLVLLDLNLPKYSGHRILERIRCSLRCPTIPVIIVTSSESETDLAENRRLGATAYFRKPSSLESFMKLGGLVKSLLTKGL